MAQTDTIADLLTRVRNASAAKHRYVDAPYSRTKNAILEIMKANGFIDNFLVDKERGVMRIFLRYSIARRPIITGIKRMSKPGLRKYVKHDEIPVVYSNLGIAIVSTSKGVVDGKAARTQKLGGELLCLVW